MVCTSDNISLHLRNIYRERELEQNRTTEFFSVVRKEGNRNVLRQIIHYNLDAILSVGYRVSSKNATIFRQWATKMLKDFLLRGYAINNRIENLERIRSADERIILIDNYVDDTVLKMLDKRKENVSTTIYTKTFTEKLQLDLQKHNAQYAAIDIQQFANSHDRFLIVDDEIYLIGASLKDLGKKMFAFSKLEMNADEFLKRVL